MTAKCVESEMDSNDCETGEIQSDARDWKRETKGWVALVIIKLSMQSGKPWITVAPSLETTMSICPPQ